MLSTEQVTESKGDSKKLPNGQVVSAPLEDMAPFFTKRRIRREYVYTIIK